MDSVLGHHNNAVVTCARNTLGPPNATVECLYVQNHDRTDSAVNRRFVLYR